MTCPNCHQITEPGAVFCGNCGFQLTANQAVQSTTGAPPTIGAQPPAVSPLSSAVMSPQTPPVSSPIPQATFNATEPASVAQQPSFQAAYAGGGGAFVGGSVAAPPSYNAGIIHSGSNNNGKAVAAFVLGVLGCIGWLIPLIGLVLGILALVFGTIALKSPRRIFAIIGIVLAIPVIALSIFMWVNNVQHILKNRSSTTSSSKSVGSATQAVSSPCYTTKVPADLKVTQTTGSCTIEAGAATSGEIYIIKVLQVPQLTASNLAEAAQRDAKNAVNLIPGASISDQKAATFDSNPAYSFTISASDGSAGTLDYVYKSTAQGDLIIIMHVTRSGKDHDLSVIEKNWSWQ